ncbi:MAG: bifunctional metallophosphatase/5'-nucleotidase [Prevotellaceae bacterium]|jgi:2',3'-cyclic-nucleotide 2'-phosphodiesterase/3'-nucleotidase|nr:bifunctional metallophosphatase/5'-nucleotidase [Prevotellaceae bacterium]
MLSIFSLASFLSSAAQEKQVKIKILQTSDVHGAIFAHDFIDNKTSESSLAHVYSYLKQLRENDDCELILLDNGDNLQGQPTVYYYNYIDTADTHVISQVMNFMQYDAASVGNHDIEAGHPVYDRVRDEYRFPLLCANAVKTNGEPYFTPYVVFTRSGVKVAVLGLITPHIPHWLSENLWSGMSFEDMLESARKWVEIIQKKEKPDILVGLFHSGCKSEGRYEAMNENASLDIALQVPGFDVVFAGHDHSKHCKQYAVGKNSVWLLDPASNARYISEVDFTVVKKGAALKSKTSKARLLSVDSLGEASPDFSLFDRYFTAVKDFVSKPVGEFTESMTTREAYFGSSAFIDFIHRIQLDVAEADISFVAPLSFDVEIGKGTIYVRDLFKLYRYENMLYAMELTGREVKDYLEFSYGLWLNTMKSPDDRLLLIHEREANSGAYRFVNPSYNFDSAAGIIYEVDVSKPVGERIQIKSMADGEAFSLDKSYRVALNSYRGSGGGGHLIEGARIAKDELSKRTVFASPVDFRFYLMNRIEKEKIVEVKPLNQWKIVPENLIKKALVRDYIELFGNKNNF